MSLKKKAKIRQRGKKRGKRIHAEKRESWAEKAGKGRKINRKCTMKLYPFRQKTSKCCLCIILSWGTENNFLKQYHLENLLCFGSVFPQYIYLCNPERKSLPIFVPNICNYYPEKNSGFKSAV